MDKVFKAISKGDVEKADELLKAGGVNSKNKKGVTPLILSIQTGQEDMVEMLLTSHKACPNTPCNEKKTPLMHAVCAMALGMARALFKAEGLEPLQTDAEGFTALHWAAKTNSPDCLEFLLDHIKGVSHSELVNLKGLNGYTPLHVALESQNEEAGLFLLSQKDLDVNYRNDEKDAALHIALKSRLPNLVGKLLEIEGIDLGVQDADGNTPLHIACEKGMNVIMKLLIAAGASESARNNAGFTPGDLTDQRVNQSQKVARAREEAREERKEAKIHKREMDIANSEFTRWLKANNMEHLIQHCYDKRFREFRHMLEFVEENRKHLEVAFKKEGFTQAEDRNTFVAAVDKHIADEIARKEAEERAALEAEMRARQNVQYAWLLAILLIFVFLFFFLKLMVDFNKPRSEL